MTAVRRGALALLAAALAGSGLRCTLLSHAEDWQVAPTVADTRLCAQCPSGAALRRPPCPGSSVPDAAPDGDGVYLFALKSIDFGAAPASSGGGMYGAGLNLDCDSRSAGAPTLCEGNTEGNLRHHQPWVTLPDGVENAFGTQVLSLVLGDAGSGNALQSEVDRELLTGAWGMVLIVDSWNGQPNDDAVGVRLLFAQLPAGVSAPKWNGTDAWDAFAEGYDPGFRAGEVPDTPFKSGGYVVGGTLVWDGRGIEGAELELENGGAPQTLSVVSPELFGPITTEAITGAYFGAISPSASLHVNANFLTGCDHQRACQLLSVYPFLGAADVNVPGATAGGQCQGMSVGMGMTFARAGSIERLIPTGRQSTCPGLPVCGDAGG